MARSPAGLGVHGWTSTAIGEQVEMEYEPGYLLSRRVQVLMSTRGMDAGTGSGHSHSVRIGDSSMSGQGVRPSAHGNASEKFKSALLNP